MRVHTHTRTWKRERERERKCRITANHEETMDDATAMLTRPRFDETNVDK